MSGSGILASSLLVLAGTLLLVVVVVVHARDVTTTLEYRGDEPLPVTGTDTQQNADTGASIRDHRHGRMALHAEVPSSKVKREQALRNILAARRRQILSQRPIELSVSSTTRTPRLDGSSTPRDPSDMLEAQETRHAMYVTASGSTRASMEEETSEVLTAKPEKSGSKPTGVVEEPSLKEADSSGGRQVAEQQSSRKASDENSTSSSNAESKPASGNSRSNYSIGHRNSSSPALASHSMPTSSSLVTPKPMETESRRKNTVPMPESLYNYFRPVESNIPVEDMTQFLYFGQKIQPESQNTTNNNTVDVTPTAPPLPSSRRRYSMKRFSTTTPVPVPKLEDIINEEMNIAVERPTVEKNKILPKLKNGFRSLESSIYYRKPRPTEATVTSNVIAELEGSSTPSSALSDKFLRDDNPSAHAECQQQQLQNASERGSGAAHVPPETRNATNSTQIPHQQPVSANMHEESTTESEISLKDHPTDMESKAPLSSNGVAATRLSKKGPRRRKIDSTTLHPVVPSITTSSSLNLDKESTTFIPVASDPGKPTPTDPEMHGYSEQKVRRADDFEVNDPTELSKNEEEEMQMDQSHSLGTRENNNIETSTLREKPSRSTSGSQYPMPWMSLAARSETSTLRIIVTEENYRRSSPIPSDSIERNTVKPVDSTLERVRSPASGLASASKLPAASSAAITIDLGSSSSEFQTQQRNHHEQQQQQQQQHVYAYTITNVTRLLRNYTGPGLSIEEQGGGGPERSSGAAEITTGSPDRAEPPPSPPLPPQPPSSSPLLPRAGSGIEASRAPAELSAGTTVEPATAGGAFTADSQVGERPRKVAAVAQQQRAPARGTSPGYLSVNKSSGSRVLRPAEVTTRGTVRWNHTKSRVSSESEQFGDRRLLRKSASAVLNQRIGGASPDDDVTFTKRRRVPNGQSAPPIGGRRLKGPGLSKTPEEAAMGTTNRPVGFNQSTTNGEKKGDSADQKAEGTVGVPQEASLGEARQGFKIVVSKSETSNSTTTEQAQNATSASSTEATFESTSTRLVPDMIEGEASELMSRNLQNNTKDRSVVTGNENDARLAPNVNEISSSSVLVTSTDNPGSSSTVTVTDAESFGAKETTTPSSTVTASTPVFPVTPETLAEAGRVSIEKETFTLKPTEPASQVTGTKTTEASGVLGAAVHLDPAEIQRMYRSKNVTTTTPPTPPSTRTPENPGTTATQDLAIPGDLTKLQEKIASGASPRKRVSSERSPEVRARNLSDKTKDKDDVLPIMQLYNTSNMFNASGGGGDGGGDDDAGGAVDAFSRGTERSPAELPVNVEGEKQRDVSRTTEKSNGAETWSRSASGARVNPARTSQRKEASTSIVTGANRRDKSEENREISSHVAPTGPGRGSSFVNASAANRTRHRPVFTPSVLPDYNGSLYPVDLNRTFFETGLISVSPSEAVNISEGISKRPNSDAVATQETVAVVSYILATLVVFPIAVGVGLILRRLILRNRKVLEESDTSSEISCRKDALNLENGDFKTSIEKAITKLPRIQHLCLEAEKPPPPTTPKSRWEFPRDKLRLQTVLGQGNFGQVWKAEADDLTGHQGTTRLVAVKTVKEGASEREKEDLVQELEIMQQLGSHPNVVTLLGCCTEQEPHYLILEYVMYGKLLAYLRDHRTRQDFYNFSEDSAALTSRDLTVFGYCVARGMEYLASKKIIHRDLAARNVLVDHNKLCKIADFGMSLFANEDGEVIETRHGRNALPIRWMAPESLIYSLFTTKTDVWSFGILMWEIVTLGSTPYPDMTAREVMRNVQNGYRLERPSHCRSELFRVISRCWHADPDRRPEFQTLRRDMAQLLEDNKNGHYVDLESFASECTD